MGGLLSIFNDDTTQKSNTIICRSAASTTNIRNQPEVRIPNQFTIANNFQEPRTTASTRNIDYRLRITTLRPLSYQSYNNYNLEYFPKSTIVTRKQIGVGKDIYRSILLNKYSEEYSKVRKMIKNKSINILSIERIENEFLKGSFNLRKKHKSYKYPLLEEVLLFHGTSLRNVDGICRNNFNWRFHGRGTGHRFGKGVCFSCNAKYASYYSSDKGEKVMFLVNVLIGRRCIGENSMLLPPEGYDTTSKKNDNIVIVKYEDNEYYPSYKIKFYLHDAGRRNNFSYDCEYYLDD